MMPPLALRLRPVLWFSGLLLLILLVEYLVVQRPDFSTHPALPAAVTFDLVVGLPLLFYFLVVRRYHHAAHVRLTFAEPVTVTAVRRTVRQVAAYTQLMA
jgi:hypothetical protein